MKRFIKIAVLCIGLYLLAVLQTSFFVPLQIFHRIPAVLLLLVILYNLFEKEYAATGLWVALIAGFLADVFSSHLFGFTSSIFLILALFIKLFVKQHVRIPLIEKT